MKRLYEFQKRRLQHLDSLKLTVSMSWRQWQSLRSVFTDFMELSCDQSSGILQAEDFVSASNAEHVRLLNFFNLPICRA